MKTNAFANLFDLQQGNQNRKDPWWRFIFQSLDPYSRPCVTSTAHDHRVVGYIRTYGHSTTAPRRPFFGFCCCLRRRHLLRKSHVEGGPAQQSQQKKGKKREKV